MICEDGRHALNSSVLVLNRFYAAIHVVNVRRSLVLLYRDLAEVVHIEDNQFWNYDIEAWCEISEFQAEEMQQTPHVEWIQCVNFQMRVPRVIRLTRYERVPKLTLRFNRRNVFARDGHMCQYCGKGFATHQLSFDHVIPRSRGGGTCWENVVCCCLSCNTRKGNRTPAEAGMKLVKPAVKPKQNPVLKAKLENPKYDSWKTFLNVASKNV